MTLDEIMDKATANSRGDEGIVCWGIETAYELGRGDAADYEQRLATQKTMTEGLQAQVEAEHTKVVKARMLIEQIIKRIPGNLLDPYAEGVDHNTVALQQAVALAKSFLEDTQ